MKTCLPVHHSRFSRTTLHKHADLTQFDAVITDAAPDPGNIYSLTQAGLSLTVAA